MSTLLLLVLLATPPADTPHPAYTADVVSVFQGKTMRSHAASDGRVTKIETDDGKSGSYTDDGAHVVWVYGPGYPCTEVPMGTAAAKANTKEEAAGSETIDGHPTKKVKVTTTVPSATVVEYQWRATDLHDLVIRRSNVDGTSESHLEHIVLGPPSAKAIAFPAGICKVDASLAASQPQKAGGNRTIRFSDGACDQIVPLPIAMSIPSDYSIRSVRPLGCFWGAGGDLDRLLKNPRQADFDAIQRGVFWCRVSENTEYDPATKHFTSEMGSDTQWAKAMAQQGATKIALAPKMIGAFPSLAATMSVQGQRVYMLYLAVPGTESLAILINYHPAGKGSATDDATWKQFVDSVQSSR